MNGYRWVPQDCPICRQYPTKVIGLRGGAYHRSGLGVQTTICKCVPCDLIFPNPMPIPVGGIAQHYSISPDEYFALHDPAAKIASAEKLIDKAESFIAKGRLLDIGSGRGEIPLAAARRGWGVTCLEPSPSFAKALREKGLTVHEDTLENVPLPSSSFDVIVLSAVLEHLYNPMKIISVIGRLLRPGGILFLDVPNEAGLYFAMGDLYYRLTGSGATIHLSPTFSPYHVFGYSMKSLSRLLTLGAMRPIWQKISPGAELLPKKRGLRGLVEPIGVKAAALLSSALGRGSYLEMWAVKIN